MEITISGEDLCECGHRREDHYKNSCMKIIDGIKETVCDCNNFTFKGDFQKGE